MATVIGKRLKKLRKQAGLFSREVAVGLKMPTSSYEKFEDRYDRPYLPLHLVAKLVNVLREFGVPAPDVWALADPDHVDAFLDAWLAKSADERATSEAESAIESRRRHERWEPMPARLSMNGQHHRCVVQDISPGGACVFAEAAHKLREAADVLLELSEFGTVPAHVAHLSGNEVGLAFEAGNGTERRMAAWLRPRQSSRN